MLIGSESCDVLHKQAVLSQFSHGCILHLNKAFLENALKSCFVDEEGNIRLKIIHPTLHYREEGQSFQKIKPLEVSFQQLHNYENLFPQDQDSIITQG